jgi:hypothetical protein
MRKSKDIEIVKPGRDAGKRFLITEMPAMQAEKWAARFFLALARSGVDIPPDIAQQGMAGIAIVGLRTLGGLQWSHAEPLLDEMFECVKIYPPNDTVLPRKPNAQEDIEEVQTIWQLRQEVLELHLGFSISEGLSKFQPTTSDMKD